ncbi:MAG: TVP38/TMEM64 family protein [Gammaproteobacteria bacterium]|nr:TVP38/TMEM64 family protein [Gammaproteobacteria bacterium]
MKRSSLSRLALAILFMALAYSLTLLPITSWLEMLSVWRVTHPVAAPLAYVLFVSLATVLFVPGSVVMMFAGFLFGFSPGVLYAVIAIPLGAQFAFEAGRWVARPWVRRKVAGNIRMQAVETALSDEAFLIILLTRLSLIIPFNVLNYAYGATAVKASTHFAATFVGMLPAVALYVYLGTLARDIGQILSGEAAPSDLGFWLIAGGIVAIAAATWVIHRTATRTLERHLSE